MRVARVLEFLAFLLGSMFFLLALLIEGWPDSASFAQLRLNSNIFGVIYYSKYFSIIVLLSNICLFMMMQIRETYRADEVARALYYAFQVILFLVGARVALSLTGGI